MKDDNYLDLDFRGIDKALGGDRRDFLKTMGGGIFIFLALGDAEILRRRKAVAAWASATQRFQCLP